MELLVVIAIIALLVSLLLPAVQSARESARRTECMNNMRNLAIAVNNYLTTQNKLPPASQFRVGGISTAQKPPDPARHSMITFLLPYFEQGNVYDAFDLRWDWNDTQYSRNDINSHQHLGGILICPSAPGGREEKHVSDYNAAVRIDPRVTGGLGRLIQQGRVRNRAMGSRPPDYGNGLPVWDGMLQRYYVNHETGEVDRRVVTEAHVQDGMSQTIMLVENAGKPICYEGGRPVEGGCNITRFRWASSTLYMTLNDICGDGKLMNCNNNSQPFGFHPGGAIYAFGDGSTKFLSEHIDPEAFVSLLTLNGNDVPNY